MSEEIFEKNLRKSLRALGAAPEPSGGLEERVYRETLDELRQLRYERGLRMRNMIFAVGVAASLLIGIGIIAVLPSMWRETENVRDVRDRHPGEQNAVRKEIPKENGERANFAGATDVIRTLGGKVVAKDEIPSPESLHSRQQPILTVDEITAMLTDTDLVAIGTLKEVAYGLISGGGVYHTLYRFAVEEIVRGDYGEKTLYVDMPLLGSSGDVFGGESGQRCVLFLNRKEWDCVFRTARRYGNPAYFGILPISNNGTISVQTKSDPTEPTPMESRWFHDALLKMEEERTREEQLEIDRIVKKIRYETMDLDIKKFLTTPQSAKPPSKANPSPFNLESLRSRAIQSEFAVVGRVKNIIASTERSGHPCSVVRLTVEDILNGASPEEELFIYSALLGHASAMEEDRRYLIFLKRGTMLWGSKEELYFSGVFPLDGNNLIDWDKITVDQVRVMLKK